MCCGACRSWRKSSELAARERAPHKVTTWVRELAAAFHGFFADCYVVAESVPAELTEARLLLVEAARIGAVGGSGDPRCQCPGGVVTGPVPFDLLPETAEVDAAGHLVVGGCDLLDLAAEFGTSLFVYDENHLRNRCREAVAAFGDGVAYRGQGISLHGDGAHRP